MSKRNHGWEHFTNLPHTRASLRAYYAAVAKERETSPPLQAPGKAVQNVLEAYYAGCGGIGTHTANGVLREGSLAFEEWERASADGPPIPLVLSAADRAWVSDWHRRSA